MKGKLFPVLRRGQVLLVQEDSIGPPSEDSYLSGNLKKLPPEMNKMRLSVNGQAEFNTKILEPALGGFSILTTLPPTWMSVVGFPSLLLNKRAKINSVFPLLSLLSADLTCLDFVAFVWLAAAN